MLLEKNGTNRLAQDRVAANLQFIKKEKIYIYYISVKHTQ